MTRKRVRAGADARVQEAWSPPLNRREAIMLRADRMKILKVASEAQELPTASPGNPRSPWRRESNSDSHRRALAAAAARRAAMRGGR